jgi:hypothetical protein
MWAAPDERIAMGNVICVPAAAFSGLCIQGEAHKGQFGFPNRAAVGSAPASLPRGAFESLLAQVISS